MTDVNDAINLIISCDRTKKFLQNGMGDVLASHFRSQIQNMKHDDIISLFKRSQGLLDSLQNYPTFFSEIIKKELTLTEFTMEEVLLDCCRTNKIVCIEELLEMIEVSSRREILDKAVKVASVYGNFTIAKLLREKY